MTDIIKVNGIECYEQDGIVYLRLETVARGLGFTTVAASGNEAVRWNTVYKYLCDLGVATSCNGADYRHMCPEFIPENIFYRLAMKAKNEAAEKFQATIADEVIPSIRKYGAYMTPDTLEAAILNPDTMIRLCIALKEEQDKRKALEVNNTALTVDNQIMKPKADYFDELVDRNLLTNFRETAKLLDVPPKKFVTFLLKRKYVYRDKKNKLQPYQQHIDKGLFVLKESVNDKTGWSGTQPLITPKGRETFRLLWINAA